MNLPLSLTVLRIFFVPLIVVLLLTKGNNMDIWAVVVFLLASTTDLLDGYLARKRGQVTAMGILLDPLADKLLTASAFISLVWLHLVPAWMVVIIVGRELAEASIGFCENGRLVYFEDASHWVQHEKVQQVNQYLLDFFATD